MFFFSLSLTVQHNSASNCSQFVKAFIFVVVNTQCQAGLLQEKSSTAQQVMRFMFPAAATALCLEINRERIGWLQWKAIANIADQAKKLNRNSNFIDRTSKDKSEGHMVWMPSDLWEVRRRKKKNTPQHERLAAKMSAKDERKTRFLWIATWKHTPAWLNRM